MDDLLQLQIRQSCKLALPDGLKELMNDISREVLRAQPADLCQFIADYLSALMVTRENIRVASKVCEDLCENVCYSGLESELEDIGLSEEDVQTIKEVIASYFNKKHVSETNLIRELMKKTEINEDQLEGVQKAVQAAFARYRAQNTVIFESSSSESDMSEATRAARFTTRLYRKSKATQHEEEKASVTIQAAYRAYGVRRSRFSRDNDALPDDIAQGRPPKALRFGSDDGCRSSRSSASSFDAMSNVTEKTEDIYVSLSVNKPYPIATASSTSLAGSYVNYAHKPYCAHEILPEENEPEYIEKESTNVDYTAHVSADSNDPFMAQTTKTVEDTASIAVDSEASVEEQMFHYEEHESDLDENIENGSKTCVLCQDDVITDRNVTGLGSKQRLSGIAEESLDMNKGRMDHEVEPENGKASVIDDGIDYATEEIDDSQNIDADNKNIADKKSSDLILKMDGEDKTQEKTDDERSIKKFDEVDGEESTADIQPGNADAEITGSKLTDSHTSIHSKLSKQPDDMSNTVKDTSGNKTDTGDVSLRKPHASHIAIDPQLTSGNLEGDAEDTTDNKSHKSAILHPKVDSHVSIDPKLQTSDNSIGEVEATDNKSSKTEIPHHKVDSHVSINPEVSKQDPDDLEVENINTGDDIGIETQSLAKQKSHVSINPELSKQYFEAYKEEKSNVPKTPFHSLTDFGLEEAEAEQQREQSHPLEENDMALRLSGHVTPV